MAFRDIGFIVEKEEKEKELSEGQSRQDSIYTSIQALF
jgi:hypothetical protein